MRFCVLVYLLACLLESVATRRQVGSVEKTEINAEVQQYTWVEVAKHNVSTDLWVTIHEKVQLVVKLLHI